MSRALPLTMHCIAYKHNAAIKEILCLPEYVKWHKRPLICEESIPENFNSIVKRQIASTFNHTEEFNRIKEIYNFTTSPGPAYLERLRCLQTFAKRGTNFHQLLAFAKAEYPEHHADFESLQELFGLKFDCSDVEMYDISSINDLFETNFEFVSEFGKCPHELLYLARQGRIDLDDRVYRVLTWWHAFRKHKGCKQFKQIQPLNPVKHAEDFFLYFNDRIGLIGKDFYAIDGGVPVKFRLI